MKKQIIRPLLTCAAALVFIGCSTAHHPSDAEIRQQLPGSWAGSGGSTITYQPDGSWSNPCMSQGHTVNFDGTWQVKDGVLTHVVTNAPAGIGGISQFRIVRVDANQMVYENEGNGKTETMSR